MLPAGCSTKSLTERENLSNPERKEYEIVADIDRLARDKGVEDIRILAGEKRLQPPSFKMMANVSTHWAVYLAIQHERYWVEVGRTYAFCPATRNLKAPIKKPRRLSLRWPCS